MLSIHDNHHHRPQPPSNRHNSLWKRFAVFRRPKVGKSDDSSPLQSPSEALITHGVAAEDEGDLRASQGSPARGLNTRNRNGAVEESPPTADSAKPSDTVSDCNGNHSSKTSGYRCHRHRTHEECLEDADRIESQKAVLSDESEPKSCCVSKKCRSLRKWFCHLFNGNNNRKNDTNGNPSTLLIAIEDSPETESVDPTHEYDSSTRDNSSLELKTNFADDSNQSLPLLVSPEANHWVPELTVGHFKEEMSSLIVSQSVLIAYEDNDSRENRSGLQLLHRFVTPFHAFSPIGSKYAMKWSDTDLHFKVTQRAHKKAMTKRWMSNIREDVVHGIQYIDTNGFTKWDLKVVFVFVRQSNGCRIVAKMKSIVVKSTGSSDSMTPTEEQIWQLAYKGHIYGHTVGHHLLLRVSGEGLLKPYEYILNAKRTDTLSPNTGAFARTLEITKLTRSAEKVLSDPKIMKNKVFFEEAVIKSLPTLHRNGFVSFSDLLGVGGYGIVMSALKDNQRVAIKYSNDTEDRIRNELKATLGLRHLNVISSLIDDMDECVDHHFLVLELAVDTLLHYNQRNYKSLNAITCDSMFKDIITGMAYIHSKGWAHMDVKLENILIVNDQTVGGLVAKISDFGECQASHRNGKPIERTLKRYGTVHFTSPDVLDRLPVKNIQTCDLWAIGVVIYELFYLKTAFPVFNDYKDRQLLDERKRYFRQDLPNIYSQRVRIPGVSKLLVDDKIQEFLNTDPSKRLSLEKFVQKYRSMQTQYPRPQLKT
jgi:hypothetical protein